MVCSIDLKTCVRSLEYIALRDLPPFWTFILKMVGRLAFFAAFCILTNRVSLVTPILLKFLRANDSGPKSCT